MYMVRTTHHGWFFIFLVPQYVSTVVLGTNTNHGMFICLVGQYCSTRYGQIITACSSFLQCASTFLLQYWVQTTHQGLFFICLVGQYVSNVVRGIDNSSRFFSSFVQRATTLVLKYLVRKTHHGLLVPQYVSPVVLGTEKSSRLVLHSFSALVRQ